MDYQYHDTSKVHVWIGNNFDEDYDGYFELDYSSDKDIDDSEYKVCGFCKDVGEKWYDEDWIGVIQDPAKPVEIDLLLKELSISDEVSENIKRVCIEKGFEQANAMFFYYDGNLVVKNKEKLYNKLAYIGMFDCDLAV